MRALLRTIGLPVTIDGSVSHDSIPWMIEIARAIRRDLRLASGEGSPYSSGRRSWAVPASEDKPRSMVSIMERPWWRDEQFASGGTRRWRVPCRVVVIEREIAGETTTRIVEHLRSDRSNSPDADMDHPIVVARRVAATVHATALRAASYLASSHPEVGYLPPPECGWNTGARAVGALMSEQHASLRGCRVELQSCSPYCDQPIIRMAGDPNIATPMVDGADGLIQPQASLELWDDRKTERPAMTLALMRRRLGHLDVPREPVGSIETLRAIAACGALSR